jgi:L-amino acid N-acyltransferase YncA
MPRTIRLAQIPDAPQILAIYAPFCRETPISFETEAPSLAEMERRIGKTLKSYPWLVCEDDQTIVGYAYASRHRERAAYRWAVDVSVYIRDGYRRTGMGRALYTSLFAVLRLQGYQSALAGATLPNPGSVALHEGMGFEPVGTYSVIGFKCGKWHDVRWWQLKLADPAANPSEPLDLEQAGNRPEWHAALQAGAALLVQ